MSFIKFYRENDAKNIKDSLRVGVVGYSDKKFDKQKASEYLKQAFDKIKKEHKSLDIVIVSGLTNLGIPALAYKEAKSRGWKTAGIACKKAKDFDLFPCDEVKIVGDDWGDESKTFLRDISILIRIGGGKQSKVETKEAKEMGIDVIEYDLEEQK